jgi:hypothetical protein
MWQGNFHREVLYKFIKLSKDTQLREIPRLAAEWICTFTP